ncbi:g2231 [Coccomyxa elongata]
MASVLMTGVAGDIQVTGGGSRTPCRWARATNVDMHRTGVQAFGNLEGLPISIVDMIASEMSVRKWAQASGTCRAWWTLSLSKLNLDNTGFNEVPLNPAGDIDNYKLNY